MEPVICNLALKHGMHAPVSVPGKGIFTRERRKMNAVESTEA